MDISPAFITDEQTPVSMEPGKSPLDNPTVFSKMSRAVNPSSGNSVFYVPYYARLPAKWKIISFISVKFLRTTSGSPMQISQGWQMIQHVFQKLAIIHIGGSEADNKRNSVTIRYNMMFASWVASIYGIGSCEFAPPFCLDNRAVNTGSAPVDLFRIVQILQDGMVKVLPNTSFLPIPKSAPAGHSTAAAHLLRQVFSRYPCLEYKDYSGQSCPVRYAWTSSFGGWLMFWQEWFNLTPQFIAYQLLGHLFHPPLIFYSIFLHLSGFVRCS